VFVTAAFALRAQEAVFQQAALEIVLELLADESGQVTARALDLLHEPRVILSNNGIERSLLRPVPVIGGRDGNRGRSRRRT
jgi:hypothetical protein